MIYKHECLFCNGSFDSERPQSKFCSGKCRVNYSRQSQGKKAEVLKKITKEEVKKVEEIKVEIQAEVSCEANLQSSDSSFIPNWKRNGFNSKEEAMIKAINDVIASRGILKKKGLDAGSGATITWQGYTIKIS
jgi:hypothetical protein